MKLKIIALLFLAICSGCSTSEEKNSTLRHRNQKGEYIYRKHNESLATIPSLEKAPQKIYPWNKNQNPDSSKITKEFFRCKGSSLNPYRMSQRKSETIRHDDCNGSAKHSLPLRDGKEFIYPILIELLNYLKDVTGKHVVITCGHRCPEHNTYADPENSYSKHMIGAEASFYIQGLEEHPEQIVKIIQNFYKITPRYMGNKEYEEFKRYKKSDTNVTTQPWYNKEIFVKIFEKKEGRNFDNRHPYPYLSIQVRYDRDTNEKVIYTWDKAVHNYHRW